jgi:hypothetical protein
MTGIIVNIEMKVYINFKLETTGWMTLERRVAQLSFEPLFDHWALIIPFRSSSCAL